jgi:hypothetical protein
MMMKQKIKRQETLCFWCSVSIFLLLGCTEPSFGPVSVLDENPHYFSFKGEPIVFVTSDHHYGAVIDRDFDIIKYLDYIQKSGLNLTRIYPGAMFEPPDKYIKGNPLGPLAGRQLLPWAKSSLPGANPLLAKEGEPSCKYDLDQWNPDYFRRLKKYVELAAERNIVVEVVFFNGMYTDCWPLMAMYHGNNIQGVGQYEADKPENSGAYTTIDKRNRDVIPYQQAYVARIAKELNAYDNIIYDICDEPSLSGRGDGSIIILPDSMVIPWLLKMKEAFADAEALLPKKHLLGQTVQNLSPDLSAEDWCEWLPAEYVIPGQKAIDSCYQVNKPIVTVESDYYGFGLTGNYTVDAIRVEGWWFMLQGGAGVINLNGEFCRGQETGGVNTRSSIVPQRKILKDFMEGFDLRGLSRFTDFSGAPADAFISSVAENGKQYGCYLFHGKYDSQWGAHFDVLPGNYLDTLTIHSVPAGHYVIEWVNPSDGSVINQKTLEWTGGDLELATPGYALDIAMRMLAGSGQNG